MGELETKDVWTTAIAAIALFFSVVGVAFTFITRRYDVNQALKKDHESKESAATERLRQRVLTAAACAHRYSVEGIQVRSTEQLYERLFMVLYSLTCSANTLCPGSVQLT